MLALGLDHDREALGLDHDQVIIPSYRRAGELMAESPRQRQRPRLRKRREIMVKKK
jgi:hypothetical protein